jgi:hypothetical protein
MCWTDEVGFKVLNANTEVRFSKYVFFKYLRTAVRGCVMGSRKDAVLRCTTESQMNVTLISAASDNKTILLLIIFRSLTLHRRAESDTFRRRYSGYHSPIIEEILV